MNKKMKGRNENKEKEYLSHTVAPPFNFKFLISIFFLDALPRKACEFNIHKIKKRMTLKIKTIT